MNARFIIGGLILLIGVGALFDINVFSVLIPLLLIYIGVQIIMGKDGMSNWGKSEQTTTQEDKIKRVLVFSSLEQKTTSDNFKGAEVVAIFGGGKLDLREVSTKEKNVKLEFVAVFGSLEVIVPKSWSVQTEGVGVLGSFNNKSNGTGKKTTEVEANGVAIFGSVEIISQ